MRKIVGRKKLLSVVLTFGLVVSSVIYLRPITANAVSAGTNDGAYGFYYSRGSTEAMHVLDWGVQIEGSTSLNSQYDTTRLDLMLRSLDYIDECNYLRALHGLPQLYVNDYMMATAQVGLNWSDTNTEHSQFFWVGENLSWNYRDPFDGWYTEEKALYDSGNRNMGEVGHYLNIIDARYTVTGFAVSTDNRGMWDISYGQTFSQGYGYDVDENSARQETVAEYRMDLMNYINTGGISPETIVDIVDENNPLDETPQIMYRLYNPYSGEHFYTASGSERNVLIVSGWQDEGASWTAPSASAVPIYRIYNSNVGDHHYTKDRNEVVSLLGAGWSYEGIGWYSDTSQRNAMYRLYNPNALTGAHHYTTDINERDQLISAGWNYEGIGWYGM